MMEYQELVHFLEYAGKDPSRLIFEDELTNIYNRRFLLNYLQSRISWDALDDHPLSLLMMDVDHFKQTNDTYGHPVGDQVLIRFAGLLREVAGEEGLAIRYAGDEFVSLLPHSDNKAALRVGEDLVQRVREEPFPVEGQDSPLHFTISVGIASAPEDARSAKSLIQEADTALYYAKKSGRDRLANAKEVVQEEVFAKTAIHQLEQVKLVGRGRQLSQTADALRKFGQRQSQFLFVEGAAGMGKSEFLETIRRSVTQSETRQVKVSGAPQEMSRPYYLTTKILIEILKQREDKGAEVFDSLSPIEIKYLAQILPQLGVAEPPGDEDKSAQRKGIFTTLLHFIPKALGNRPLILLIDDLHFADEATLILLRGLISGGQIPVFICGTCTESKEAKTEQEMAPSERFYKTFHQEPGTRKVSLTPLMAADIAKHIKGIFPNASLPKGFEKDLAQISQGNPLFLCEILRKLVLDQKITLVGRQWVFQPVDEGYFPRSLEEIVTQKIADLNEESRQMLEHASALGEDVSLSMLIGASDKMEAKVLEFIDHAVSQGLLSSDFQLNDETIHFLGKRILEIAYGGIEQDRKQKLHERIGIHQETLYQQRLLPSAATLAYHFKRSTDQEKATNYEQLQASSNNKIFNAQEALSYAAEGPSEGPAADMPLNPEDLPSIPLIIRHLTSAVHNIKLYPPGSKSIITATRRLKKEFDLILKNNEYLSLIQTKGALVINSQKMDVTEFKLVAKTFLQLLSRFVLKGISFRRGLTEHELEVLVEALGRSKQRMFDEGFWERFSVENQLIHIDLKQVRYAMKGGADVSSRDQEAAERSDTAQSVQEELRHIADLLRGLLAAARAIRLYPLKSKAISGSVGKLMKTLRSFLRGHPSLTLSHVTNSLLVNGERVDTSDFSAPADSFLKFLDFIGLSSLTFLECITAHEVETFIGALGRLPSQGADTRFWNRIAKEQGLSGILFDQHLYESRVALASGAGKGQDIAGQVETVLEKQPDELIPEELFERFLQDLPGRIRDLFLNGDEDKIKQTIGRLFQGLQNRELPAREKVIAAFQSVPEVLTLAFQHDFAKFLADPFLAAFLEECDPKMIIEMGAFLHRLAGNLIQFTEYPLASRILSHLHMHHRQLNKAEDAHARVLGKILERKLEPTTERLLVEDLKCGESSRQRNAAQLLGSVGQVAIPLLIDIIKHEENYRARRIAAVLLQEVEPKAADLLKTELLLQIAPEERWRILEIVDTLTRDLKTELVHALSDEDPGVRHAGFRLAERLKDSQVSELLLDYAKREKADLAVDAIKCLGNLKPPMVVKELLSLFDSTKEEARRIACCRALGQIADPACIEPLARILVSKSIFFLRKRYSGQVRAAAALALGQISDPRVVEVLAPLVNDRDPSVGQIAQSVLDIPESSPPSQKPHS